MVVSPHLDDAVLSCGQLLAGSPGCEVVTVFTAGPPTWEEPTPWDVSCGFAPGDDVMAVRKGEDTSALAVLGAHPRWLDVVEGQYDPTTTVEALAERLASVLAGVEGSPVLVPLGLYHPDHRKVADAVDLVRPNRPDIEWWAYADQPYAELEPASVPVRLAQRGITTEPSAPGPLADVRAKRAALRRYRSQVRPLRGSIPKALRAERCWRLP
ncbi:MAG: LmbE family protein [Actinomycetia bacterium]|nr:LmbE family protein [Actinomycetes bacterium]